MEGENFSRLLIRGMAMKQAAGGKCFGNAALTHLCLPFNYLFCISFYLQNRKYL